MPPYWFTVPFGHIPCSICWESVEYSNFLIYPGGLSEVSLFLSAPSSSPPPLWVGRFLRHDINRRRKEITCSSMMIEPCKLFLRRVRSWSERSEGSECSVLPDFVLMFVYLSGWIAWHFLRAFFCSVSFCQILDPGWQVQVNRPRFRFPGCLNTLRLTGWPLGVHVSGLSPGLVFIFFAGAGHWWNNKEQSYLIGTSRNWLFGSWKMSLWCLAVKSAIYIHVFLISPKQTAGVGSSERSTLSTAALLH